MNLHSILINSKGFGPRKLAVSVMVTTGNGLKRQLYFITYFTLAGLVLLQILDCQLVNACFNATGVNTIFTFTCIIEYLLKFPTLLLPEIKWKQSSLSCQRDYVLRFFHNVSRSNELPVYSDTQQNDLRKK